jgi:hypothetical protein
LQFLKGRDNLALNDCLSARVDLKSRSQDLERLGDVESNVGDLVVAQTKGGRKDLLLGDDLHVERRSNCLMGDRAEVDQP